MLSYQDAFRLLSTYGSPDVLWIRHCVAVSRAAEHAANQIAARHPLDVRFVTVGGLLHDIGRSRTQHPVQHGVEGYRLLSSLGHHEEAFICAAHLFCGMGREEASGYGLPDRDFYPRSLEERLIPLIDSVVELDRATTLEARLASIIRRYQGDPRFLQRIRQAGQTAERAMRELERDFGISVEQAAREALGPA